MCSKHALRLTGHGVSFTGVKVHVKIIGATTSDDEDDDTTLHVLSEEESASFQNMIVAILVSFTCLCVCFHLFYTYLSVRVMFIHCVIV